MTGRDPRTWDLTGVRIGVTMNHSLHVPVEPAMRDAVERAAAVLEGLGATVSESEHDFSGADEVFRTTRALEFAGGIGTLLDDHSDEINAEIAWNVEEGFKLSITDVLESRRLRAKLQDESQRYFSQYDLLLSPGAQLAPFRATERWPKEVAGQSMGNYLEWMRSATILSAVGIPTVALPAGFDSRGLPVGVQFSANHLRDPWLLQCAWAYERATEWTMRAPDLNG